MRWWARLYGRKMRNYRDKKEYLLCTDTVVFEGCQMKNVYRMLCIKYGGFVTRCEYITNSCVIITSISIILPYIRIGFFLVCETSRRCNFSNTNTRTNVKKEIWRCCCVVMGICETNYL